MVSEKKINLNKLKRLISGGILKGLLVLKFQNGALINSFLSL